MSHPKRGKCVTLLTGDGIRHRYELCGLLEGAAAANVVLSLPKGPWEELEALLDRMEAGRAFRYVLRGSRGARNGLP